jgi:hypothetical protein
MSFLLPKLITYKTSVKGHDIEFIKTIAEKHKKKLKSIKLFAQFNDYETNNFLQVSLLKSLEIIEFNLFINYYYNGLHFDTNRLKNYCDECIHLKEIKLRIELPVDLKAAQIFECMSSFKQLKYLYLCLDIRSPGIQFSQNTVTDEFRSETIKLLTYLVTEKPAINQRFLKNIYKNLPKLQVLNLRALSDGISDMALYSVSNLKKTTKTLH